MPLKLTKTLRTPASELRSVPSVLAAQGRRQADIAVGFGVRSKIKPTKTVAVAWLAALWQLGRCYLHARTPGA